MRTSAEQLVQEHFQSQLRLPCMVSGAAVNVSHVRRLFQMFVRHNHVRNSI